MGRRLIREMRQAIMIILLLGAALFMIWLFSLMSGVLGWLWENKMPVGIGFATALVTKGAINVVLGDGKNDRYEDEDYEDEEDYEEEDVPKRGTKKK